MNLAKTRLGLAVWLILAIVTSCFYGLDLAYANDTAFGHPAFETIYNRVDSPAVNTGSRPYIWDKPLSVKTERWDSATDKQRTVQYFSKGKMELNQIAGAPPTVTFSRLAHDLATGAKMVSDDRLQAYDPSILPVYGDLNPRTNPAPRYADFTRDVFGSVLPNRVGRDITTIIRSGRRFAERSTRLEPKVQNAYYEVRSGRNIAEPFWTFFNATGKIRTVTGAVTDGLLFNWQEVVGYPLSDPYWMFYLQDGKTTEAIVQLFEKRVLLYIPSAPDETKIQFNDVGAHYLSWAYDPYPGVGNQDTSVPESINGKVVPSFGGITSIFRIHGTGFASEELVNFSVTRPDKSVISGRFYFVRADKNGKIGGFFFGDEFVSFSTPDPKGIYTFTFTGTKSKNVATLYYRLIELPPETPTKPFTIPTEPVPPSINALVEPNSGGTTTNFIALFNNIFIKNLFTPEGRQNYSTWVTDPDGAVYNEDLLNAFLDETPFGIVLSLLAPPTPGLWAITLQIRSDPSKISIIYLRVTDEPAEFTVNLAFAFNRFGSVSKVDPRVLDKLPFLKSYEEVSNEQTETPEETQSAK
jgi:hypothetical protein